MKNIRAEKSGKNIRKNEKKIQKVGLKIQRGGKR